MKKNLRIFGIVFLVFMVLIIVWGFFFVNREDDNYISRHSYVDAASLKQKIQEKGEDAIVLITSPGCSGESHFMPVIQKDQALLKEKNIIVYYVIQMLNTEKDDESLSLQIKKYNIKYEPLVMDPTKYPSGNLFNAKDKYNTFLTELCGNCNDGSLGYPFYVYYKNGSYVGKSYYLDESLLTSIE